MAKGRALALLGIIIGAIGIGVGGYSYWLLQSEIAANEKAQGDLEDEIEDLEDDTDDLAVTNVWNVRDLSADIDTSWAEVLGDMTIVISVNPGESVYISFTAYVYVPGGAACSHYIYVDGYLSNPTIQTGLSNTGATFLTMGTSMQGTLALSAGTHTITVEALANGETCVSYSNYLYIHTYR